jgi:uncharacterized membrane protein
MSFPELKLKKPDFLKNKFEVTYFVIALVLSGLLVATVALPYIAVGYSLERQYTLAITILSVFFVIGGMVVAKYLNKLLTVLQGKTSSKKTSQVRAYLIILLVLIPYFLCTTGVMYNIFGVPRAITLNSEGEQHDSMYVHDQESYGAKWLKEYRDHKTKIYGDTLSRMRLTSQAGIRAFTYAKAIFEDKRAIRDGYIYLRYYNVVNGKLMGLVPHDMTEYSDIFGEMSKVYANGGAEIWKK